MSNVYRRRKKQTSSEKDDKNSSSSNEKETKNSLELNILLGLVVFRLCNVGLVQTWFVPDEYWQAPEVAHKMVYDYGYQTWEWKEGIRGYSYPLIFAILFRCIQFLRIDWPKVVIYSPRILQAICGAVGELFVYKFAKLIWGTKAAWWTLYCHITSWFIFYCITRTLTNSMETVFISVALYYWQLSESRNLTEPAKSSSVYKALFLASISCLVRPTAMIVWFPLGIARLWSSKSQLKFFFKFILPVSIVAMVFSIALDSWFYNKLILVQYNFLHFNIIQNIGELYGTHPWHW